MLLGGNMEREALSKWNAAREYIQKVVFPILYIVNDKEAGILGTGFLLENERALYLCTARHVLEEKRPVNYDRIAIPIKGSKKGSFSLPSKPQQLNRFKNIDPDFSIVPLHEDSAYYRNAKSFWQPVTLNSFYTGLELEDHKFMVYGFPSALKNDGVTSKNIETKSLGFSTEYYSDDTIQIENYTKPETIIQV